MTRNLVLCGFMGCGKSTVGRLVAERCALRFVDIDRYIEEEAGQTVSDIFASEGEEGFRRRERAACEALGAQAGLVIATGGGAVLDDRNVASLRRNGILVWLSVSPLTVIARLQNDGTRPLLQREDRDEAIRTLLAARAPHYARVADTTVDADGTPAQVVETLCHVLRADGLL